MPKDVSLADDIYEHIQAEAVPLEDDVNTVLRRLLGLPEPKRPSAETRASANRQSKGGTSASQARPKTGRRKKGRKRAPKGSILAEEAYEIPILQALDEFDGRGPTSEVIDRVGEILDGQLTAADFETLKSGDVRWKNRAQFVRLSLIKKGDMKGDSPRGVWEISAGGRERLRRERS